jgi:peptide/nickel transport system substrate-binding protein
MEARYTWWQRQSARRIGRRRMLQGSAFAGAGTAAWALVGCGDDSSGGSATPGGGSTPKGGASAAPSAGSGGTPKTGGHFNMWMGGSPRSLDPHFDTFPYNTAITDNTNNGLLQFDRDVTKIEPDLATGMPEQPDDQTYTFKITPGVKFQNVDPVNGREFTAEDAKYSIQRQMTDDAGKFQHAYYFLNHVDKIDTPDKYTMTVHTSTPYAPFINYIASPWTVMICREVVEKYGDLTEHAVGTGPFILTDWQKDVKFELKKNPDYFRKGRPYIDQLSFLLSTDPATTATLFLNKSVDAVIVGQSNLDRVKEGRPDAVSKDIPSQFWKEFRMPPTTKDQPYAKPFDDPRVRQAIVQAIDKQQVLDLVYSGDGILTHGPILPIYKDWALKEEEAAFDLKKAQDLMGQAGQSGGFSGEMIWASTAPELDQIAEVVKQQLAKIKVDLQLKPMELAAYYNQTYSYKYTFSSHTPLNSPEPDENLSSYFGKNSTYYKHYNTEIFDLIDKQSSTVDVEQRKQLVQEVQKKIVQDYTMSFMFTTNNHNFVDPKVKGWFWSTDLYNGRVESVWLDA